MHRPRPHWAQSILYIYINPGLSGQSLYVLINPNLIEQSCHINIQTPLG